MEASDALALVNRIYDRLNGRRGDVQDREDHYLGKQPLSFATQEWRKANEARYEGFADNWCQPVVDAEAERLKHTGIKFGRDENDEAAAKALWEHWLLNDMEAQSSQGFVSSLTTSRSFVIVWGDSDGQPVDSWEHPSSVEVEYDAENPRKRVAALKTWADDDTEYATLYTPDEVWKFSRQRQRTTQLELSQAQQQRIFGHLTGGWEPRQPKTDDTWPIPNPIGEVPVVEVPNRPLLAGDPVSEIAGVIPMQAFINLMWAYLMLSADYASMPARVVLGQGPPMMPILDDQGKKIGEKPVDIKDLAEKRLLYLTNKETKIDSWEAAKLDAFTDTIDIAVGHIAAHTRTPPTYLVTKRGMSNVNADGLKASEIGLVKKTLEFQTFATPAMREVHRLNALVLGDKELAKKVRLGTMAWQNPEIRSEAQLADALAKKRSLGYPLEYLMELDGIDPLDIERIMAMREQELRDPQIEAATRELTALGTASE